MTQKITFIIAPVGCAFHHIGPICQVIGARYWTEVSREVEADKIGKLLNKFSVHQAVFAHNTKVELEAHFPDSDVIAYYDACRLAGVSPFHTGSGQLIAPLNHAASLAARGSQLQPATIELPTYGVMMEVVRERAKQISKGYDASHDDEHACDELAAAAAWYAMPEACREWQLYDDSFGSTIGQAILPDGWMPPVEGDRRRQPIKAAAMMIAEIERLDRAEAIRICNKAVDGYQCSRAAGHEGPCAAFIQSFDND